MASPDLDLDQLRALWPGIVDAVCDENQLVGHHLAEGRPVALEADRLTVCFPDTAAFSQKTLTRHSEIVMTSLRAVTGRTLTLDLECGGEADEDEPTSTLSEEELLERLKNDFGAKEIFED